MRHTDYLHQLNIEFIQDDRFLKVGTDTTLLGTFPDNLKGKSILDIGTNTGALLLYAWAKGAGHLTGLDIHRESLDLASENLSKYTEDYVLFCTRVQDFQHEPFDVLLCNPPFFEESNVQRLSKDISEAMFDGNLPIPELFASIKRLLKDNGSAYIIYHADRTAELINECEKNKLKICKMQFVYNEKRPYAHRVLLKIKHGKQTKINVIKPVFLSNRSDN